MVITLSQLATAVNGCGHITPESQTAAPGMVTWEIDILNQYCHIVDRSYHTGWYQEEAERIARERCKALHEFTWQVLPIKKEG
jgi:hypothetical protein